MGMRTTHWNILLILTYYQQVTDMVAVTQPRHMAHKEGQMEVGLLQDTVVARRLEVKILQVAQRYAD
jgi:hypothetical protein